MTCCKLCKKKKQLVESHLIPKFVYNWLKNTSITGYLRRSVNINKRMQDGDKPYLFCTKCEELFSKLESYFARKIFYPYVNKELDDWGIATGTIPYFSYTELLLKFIISLQYRHLVRPDPEYKKELDKKKTDVLISQIPIWEKYLLGERSDTGNNRSYVIFLQNIAFASGYFPRNMSPKINRYLLRSIDGTVISNKKKLGIYTKIGPIIVYTTIIPKEINKMNNIVVRKKGNLSTTQYLKDKQINKFIFIDRPNEVIQTGKISEKQQRAIEKSVRKNKDKVLDSLGTKSYLSDMNLSSRLKKK